MQYKPEPIDTDNITLPTSLQPLVERLAEDCHDNWAKIRLETGWTYGPRRNDETKTNPCLVPYNMLSEEEKDVDRNSVISTLKLIIKFGYTIS